MQYSLETYEVKKICRCCLKSIGVMKPLYGLSLDEMLRSVTSLRVEPNDGLPELMCYQCVLQLSRAFRFREQCRKSNTIISEHINNAPKEVTKSIALSGSLLETLNTKSCFENVSHTMTPDNEEKNNEYHTICEDDYDCSSVIQEDSDQFENTPNKEVEHFQNTGVTQFIHVSGNTTEFKCRICKKQFSGRKQLVRHIKIHDINKPYKCSECDKTFAERCNLKKHSQKHTGELRNATNKPHLCSICGNSFKYSSSLSKHMKFHTGKNLLYCPHCPKYYVEKSALQIHLRRHTGDRPHVCHLCDRRFTQACNLQKHLRSHSGERPFKCSICERTFVERDYLTIHMQTHNSEKKALCSVCGKRFANAKTLDAHMRIHAEKRSYICGFESCSKTFSRLDTALVHRRIHTGEKPYSCDICNHLFTTSTQLSNHLRTHTGEKPFACELCPKKFASKTSLRSHINKHSSTQSAEDTTLQRDLFNQELKNSNNEQVLYRQDVHNHHEKAITEQLFKESVLLFKINENGELVPETECTSVAKMSTV